MQGERRAVQKYCTVQDECSTYETPGAGKRGGQGPKWRGRSCPLVDRLRYRGLVVSSCLHGWVCMGPAWIQVCLSHPETG